MGVHSPFGASVAHRWISCPASIALCQKAPRKESSFEGNKGTAAHSLAEMSLRQRKMPRHFVGQHIQVGDDLFEVDTEMADYVSEYVYEVLQVASTRHNPGVVDPYRVETRFDLDWIGRPGMFGTCDASLADTAHRTLHVFDLKYGSGEAVVAENNPQLMYYALGVLGVEGLDKFDTVRLVIVQPRHRATGTTDWTISVPDLLNWRDKVLIPAYDEACGENPRFGPSEKACKWCAGKPICPAIGSALAEAAGTSLTLPTPVTPELVFPEPASLTDEQVSKILTMLPLLKPYFEAVSAYALDKAMQGDVVSGFKLVAGRQGNRVWTDEKAVTEAFASLGEDLYDKKLKSPAQMEKLLGKGGKQKLDPFVSRSEAKLSLAPVSDKREAVEPPNRNLLETFFGECEDE